MHNTSKLIIMCLSVLFLNGCAYAIDKKLSPPSDSQWVNVEVKNPSRYTKPFPLEVTYISHKCLKDRTSGFNGASESESSYNGIKIPLQQQSGSDVWSAKVAMKGGGLCEWTLSEFNLGIQYTDAVHLGKDLVPGTAVGATIAFDNDASKNGQFRIVNGDLKMKPRYYPYITEWNLIKHSKELSLLGEDDFLSYRVMNAEKISFAPSLDESKVVKYIEPEVKIKGVHPKIIYPDGTVVSDGTVFPDFDKVDKMQ